MREKLATNEALVELKRGDKNQRGQINKILRANRRLQKKLLSLTKIPAVLDPEPSLIDEPAETPEEVEVQALEINTESAIIIIPDSPPPIESAEVAFSYDVEFLTIETPDSPLPVEPVEVDPSV